MWVVLDERLLRAAGLDQPGTALARPLDGPTGDVWLLSWDSIPVVVKRGRAGQDGVDIQWEHRLLQRLAEASFPAPRPVPIFDGASWLLLDDRVWSAVTYLPGRTLDGEQNPSMETAGAILAAYHRAAWTISVVGQRLTATPLEQLAELARWDRIAVALGDASAAERLRGWTDGLIRELEAFGYGALTRIVVHGDCTLHNIVIDGDPPRPVGLIDFGSAYQDAWLLDLGAGLWRAGRVSQEAIGLDPGRVARFAAGYHARRPLAPDHARAIPTLIRARGLQLIVRRTRRATPGVRRDVQVAFARTGWLREHQVMLEDAISSALDV
jgi:Ser/Thr protein kinase RdoA (MazF antagonist)